MDLVDVIDEAICAQRGTKNVRHAPVRRRFVAGSMFLTSHMRRTNHSGNLEHAECYVVPVSLATFRRGWNRGKDKKENFPFFPVQRALCGIACNLGHIAHPTCQPANMWYAVVEH